MSDPLKSAAKKKQKEDEAARMSAADRLMMSGITIQGGEEWLKNTKPIQWLFDQLLVRGYCYTFTSPTNHGKTTVMSYLIARCLGGLDVGEFKNCVGRMNVLLLCGENDVDTAHKVQAALNSNGVNDTIGLYVIDKAFPIGTYGTDVVELANSFGVDFHLVVADTWQAYWSGGEFNGNEAQLDHARAMRLLTTINGNPTTIIPAHPVKNAGKDNLVPYGGGSAMNEVDGNFTGWKDGDVFTMKLEKKRQPEVPDISFELRGVTIPQMTDINGNATPSAVVSMISGASADLKAADAHQFQDSILRTIDRLSRTTGGRVTKPMIAIELGVNENKLRSPMDILSGKGGDQISYITTKPIALTKHGASRIK